MKTAAVCLLLVPLVAISVLAGVNQSRTIGKITEVDRILDRSMVFKPARQNHVVVTIYQYPKLGGGGIISCIKVIDRFLNGTNGDVYTHGGGVGQRRVGLSFRSKRSYSIHYDIEVWGR